MPSLKRLCRAGRVCTRVPGTGAEFTGCGRQVRGALYPRRLFERVPVKKESGGEHDAAYGIQ